MSDMYQLGRSRHGIVFSYSKPMPLQDAEDLMRLMLRYFPKDVWEVVPAEENKG